MPARKRTLSTYESFRNDSFSQLDASHGRYLDLKFLQTVRCLVNAIVRETAYTLPLTNSKHLSF